MRLTSLSESDNDVKRQQAAVAKGGGGLLVIGLNQTIDRTVRLAVLAPGEVLRAADVAVTPGGKAVNVCRAATTLGASPRLVGPFPGELGRFATGRLVAERLDVVAVPVAGEIRGTTVVIEDSGRTTVVNEPGPPLDLDGWQRTLAAVEAALRPGVVVAISGSSPPGAPADAHRILIDLIHARSGWVAVDVAGEALIASARAGADLLSPNLAEAEAAITSSSVGPGCVGGNGYGASESVEPDGADDSGEVAARAGSAAAALVHTGAVVAVVSAGRAGAAYRTASDDGFVDAPAVDVVNPIGAGDALLGAMLVAIEQGEPVPIAVRRGVAYAAASVAHPTAGYADPALASQLAARMVNQ